MSSADLSQLALELPPQERLELARRLVESVVSPEPFDQLVKEGIRRIEDMVSGKVKGLSEEEFRAALK
jgi:putative addiction module component (TIGR02574 family)